MDDTAAHAGSLGAFARYAFRVAVAYCVLGIAIELLRPKLPVRVYAAIAETLYGVPMGLLARLGLAAPLAEAAIQGKVPTWLAAAAAPAVGVALVFLGALLGWALVSLFELVLSLKQRA